VLAGVTSAGVHHVGSKQERGRLVHVLEPAAKLPLSQQDYDDLAAKESTKLLADVDKDQKENSAHHHSANAVKVGTGEVAR